MLTSKPFFKISAKQMLSLSIRTTLQSTMLFGTFGFLTKKVQADNEGRPLTHYQNFGCGLFAGAVGACISAPFYVSYNRLFESANLTRTSIIQDLYGKAANQGILALWKGGIFVGRGLWVSNMGMLAMYNPCYEYLRESVGLTANSSVLGTGLMSGFFASTSSYPYIFVHKAMTYMEGNTNVKYPFTSCLDFSLKVLKFNGPLAIAFYRGSAPYILLTTTHVTVLWYFLEKVKKTFGW